MGIVIAPAPILEQPTVPVDRTNMDRLEVAADLLIELGLTEHAAAIAAPQIGSSMRMFAYRDRDGRLDVLVNPWVIEESGRQVGTEGCLSFPDRVFVVPRPKQVIVEAVTIEGDYTRRRFAGFFARMACHEIDHLDGVLVTSRAIGGKR